MSRSPAPFRVRDISCRMILYSREAVALHSGCLKFEIDRNGYRKGGRRIPETRRTQKGAVGKWRRSRREVAP